MPEAAYIVAICFLSFWVLVVCKAANNLEKRYENARQEWRQRENALLERLTGIPMSPPSHSHRRPTTDAEEWQIEQERMKAGVRYDGGGD